LISSIQHILYGFAVINVDLIYRSLIGSLVIGAELGREDHGSIPVTAIGRGLKLLDVRTDP
jgi:hypothetical protein